MRKLIFVALIAAGVWYWQKYSSARDVILDEAGNPAVLIYTEKQCGAACEVARNMLDSRGVPYQEKELDLEDEQNEDVKRWRRIGGNRLPLTLAGHSKVNTASKWELIGLLGNNFGDTYLTQEEQGYFARHFDASGAPMVVLYGTSWCPGCAKLRKELEEHGVSFVDIDVEKSGEFEKLTRVMEIPGYPATWVGYNRVNGFTFDAVKAAMN